MPCKRHTYVVLTLIVLLMGACAQIQPSASPVQADSFQIVVMPDTQQYAGVAANQPLFAQQTQWIVDNLESENIRFVTQLGDVVDQWTAVALDEQRQVADAAFDILDGEVPYSVTFGTHDLDVFNNSSKGSRKMQPWFGDDRYQGYDWYGGASPDGENFYQLFSAGGFDFIHLNLKFVPDQAALDWAQEILAAHPQQPAILSTHAYLTDEAGCGRAKEGEMIWEGLVRSSDQIFMVIGGHYDESEAPTVSGEFNEDGECHQISQNDAGREVYELLANYQGYPNGGDGWLQLIQFDVENDQINVRTYSPFLDAFQTDANSQFSFEIDFASRLKQ